MFKEKDHKYMRLALNLAKKAEGMTSPNPMVGAVLVKNGKLIGKGYHRKAGLPHAEVEAFTDAEKNGYRINGADLYVTLEPCSHRNKRTPPCTDSIIERKIKKVYIGTMDQNPEVKGKSMKLLRRSGVEVKGGILEEECTKLNEKFFKYITNKVPFVTLKLASTLDGKIATISGDSKWIGSEKQRKLAHRLRNSSDAILVGINTILIDNPSLNVRLNKNAVSQPIPVILDSDLRISPDSNLFNIHDKIIVAANKKLKKSRKAKRLEDEGCSLIFLNKDKKTNSLSLKSLLVKLGKMEITSLLIEGGGKVASSALLEKVVDKLVLFYSPKIIGGDGKSMISKLGISKMSQSINLGDLKLKRFGEEYFFEGYL